MDCTVNILDMGTMQIPYKYWNLHLLIHRLQNMYVPLKKLKYMFLHMQYAQCI
jgi:hypothetical protein